VKHGAQFYLIRLEPPPSHCGAYHNRASNYRWEIRGNEANHNIEISFLQEGSLNKLQDGRESHYPQGSIITLTRCRRYFLHSTDPVFHEFHFTFLASHKPEQLSTAAAANWEPNDREAILADHLSDSLECRRIGKIIKSMIGIADSDHICRELRLQTALYRCLAIMTRSSVLQAQREMEQEQRKTDDVTLSAICYIREHLSEPLSLSTVAKAINVNYHTLRSSFRKSMNMTLTDHINNEKIRAVEKLITAEHLTLAQAGAAVGIRDPDYLSRLFHKCTGMTAREYRRIYTARWEKSMNAPK